jgi:hypothetical protein
MFDHTSQVKLELYRTLSTYGSGEYQVNHFGNLHNLTYHQMIKLLTEIDEDLKKIDEGHETILQKNGKILLNEKMKKLDAYRCYLLQDSLPFKVLNDILSGETYTVEEYCELNNIGRSTLYRKLANLIEFFKDYGIRICYTPLGLVGDEALIRLILGYLFWIGYRGMKYPKSVNEKFVDQLYHRFVDVSNTEISYVSSKQIKNTIAVSLARLESGKICSGKREWNQVFDEYPVFDSEIIYKFKFKNAEEQKNELYYWYFLTFFLHYYSNENDTCIKQTLFIFSSFHPIHPVMELTNKFIFFAKKEIIGEEVPTKDLQMLQANLIHIAYAYYCFNGPIPDFEILTEPMHFNQRAYYEVYQKVEDFFESLFREMRYKKMSKAKENLIRRYTNLLVPFVVAKGEVERLKIGIALERNPVLQHNLRLFLNRLNFIELEEFNPFQWATYDVVIHSTSALREEFPTLNTYLWDIGFGEKEMYRLYQALHHQFIKKSQQVSQLTE